MNPRPEWEALVKMSAWGGQIGLLGIWVGFGRGRWFLRLPVAVVPVIIPTFLEIITTAARPLLHFFDLEFLAVLAMGAIIAIISVAVPLWVVRMRYRRLVLFATEVPPAGSQLQFSISHMLVGMLVLSVLLASAHLFRPLGTVRGMVLSSPASVSAVAHIAIPGVLMIAFLIAPTLLAVWVCLGTGKPMSRLVVALFAVLTIGNLFAYYFDGGAAEYALWSAMTMLEFMVIAGSLLVFRSVGYRLVPHSAVIPGRPTPVDGDA